MMMNVCPHLTPKALEEMTQRGVKPILLDVRDEEEYERGHLAGAVCLPVRMLEEKIGLMVRRKETPVALYCRSGARSRRAARTLLTMGYEHVWDLGGLTQWSYRLM